MVLFLAASPSFAVDNASQTRDKGFSRTCGDNKILYFVGWVGRDFNFHDKPISFDSRRSPPNT